MRFCYCTCVVIVRASTLLECSMFTEALVMAKTIRTQHKQQQKNAISPKKPHKKYTKYTIAFGILLFEARHWKFRSPICCYLLKFYSNLPNTQMFNKFALLSMNRSYFYFAHAERHLYTSLCLLTRDLPRLHTHPTNKPTKNKIKTTSSSHDGTKMRLPVLC